MIYDGLIGLAGIKADDKFEFRKPTGDVIPDVSETCFSGNADPFGAETRGMLADFMKNWQVYIIQCSDGSLYTGVSTDPQRRFREHRSGGPRAAKFFRGRRAESLVYVETGLTRSEACRREWEIKQLGRRAKLRLIGARR